MKTFHLLAGLPRSGSTLLSSLFQQHPSIHGSPNSLLIGILYEIERLFRTEEQAKAFQSKNQLEKTLYFAAHGYYSYTDKPIIIDKSRAWPSEIPLAKKSFSNNTKVIATVRSIPDILASFVTLAEKNPDNYIDKLLKDRNLPITNHNRCEFLISGGGTIFESYKALKSGYDSHKDEILFVEYDDLVSDTHTAMDKIYKFLNLPYFHHDLNNIINHTPEDDSVYGIDGMHSVRKTLSPSTNKSIDILGEELYNQYLGSEFWR
jgi:sulfotransferase